MTPSGQRPEKRPTLRTIASAMGLSHATISMALRNHPLVAIATRQRVQRAARKLGYRPDPEVAKLMHHLRLKHKPKFKSAIAALTTADEGEPSYNVEVRIGAQRAAEELGYGFNLFRVRAGNKRDASLQRILRTRGVDGVLLLPMKSAISLTDYLDWNCFSVVAATYAVTTPSFHRVVPEQFGNTLLICEQLARRGCRRIGLVIDAELDRIVGRRFCAAVMWQNNLGGTEYVAPFIHDNHEFTGFAAWFTRERPDAIIVGSDAEARLLAAKIGLRIPGRVRFALTDRQNKATFGGVDQRPEEIGAAAMARLHAEIQRAARGVPSVPSVTMIQGDWIEARSKRSVLE